MLAKEERHIGIAVWQHLGQRCEQGIKDLGWFHLSSLSATTAVTPTSDGARMTFPPPKTVSSAPTKWSAVTSIQRSVSAKRIRSPAVGPYSAW